MPEIKYQMANPPHPGLLLRELIEGKNLSTYQTADLLGINRPYLSKILNGHQGISVLMALRIEKAFASDYRTWLGMQQSWDVWQARNDKNLDRVKFYQISNTDSFAVS